MIRFARRLGFPALSLVCVMTLGWPHAVRTALYRSLYPLVAIDPSALAAPPDRLTSYGYVVDPPDELAAFRAAASPAVSGVTDDGARLRHLTDLIYSYHPGRDPFPVIPGGRERGVRAIFDDIVSGQFALCGHKTLVLAAMWRSLGGDVRQIRFTAGDEIAWYAAHYGIEVYSSQWRKWFYYDATLNGYAAANSGEPLSLVELNERLARGDDVAMVASEKYTDWSAEQFLAFLRLNRLQVYSLNNRMRGQDPDRRFGILNFGYAWLSQLPRPLDRVVDAVTGDGGRRFVVRGGSPPPASAARMHLVSASPRPIG
ncbi:MAG: hypothetical protein EPO35_11385 [Acidobacteria bacterium]|nr:MAG: hypothetical protein EPO35_11385 [Acidobacteriota bacterium]